MRKTQNIIIVVLLLCYTAVLHAQNALEGKTYTRQVNWSCGLLPNGSCVQETFEALTFQKKEVTVFSYRTLICVPDNRNNSSHLGHRKQYQWKQKKDGITIAIKDFKANETFQVLNDTTLQDKENREWYLNTNIVSGKITKEHTEFWANIHIKNTKKRTMSNALGEYVVLQANPNDTLVYTYLDHKTKEIAINGQTLLDVILTPIDSVYKQTLDNKNNALAWRELPCGLWENKHGEIGFKIQEYTIEGNFVDNYVTQFNKEKESIGAIIDTTTFRRLGKYGYYADANHIYTYNTYTRMGGTSFTILMEAEVSSFQGIGNGYAKDKNQVYCIGAENQSIKNADPNTFKIPKTPFMYAKDKDGYFLRGERIDKASVPIEILNAFEE